MDHGDPFICSEHEGGSNCSYQNKGYQAEYEATVWFLDDDTYEYPYCKTDSFYFDY